VSGEPPIVLVDRAAGNHTPSRLELRDLIHEEKRVAVRQDRLDLVLPEGDGRRLHEPSLLAGSPC
jgi:hypothetical protein